MKSAIQKNLGGPLSEVFFSSLNPVQQDHIGYTPKLQGPGRDLWVSPSDNLIGKVILKPPYTTKIKQSLTHQGILEIGAKIEQKIIRAHEIEMEATLKQKEEEMKELTKQLIKEAVEADRLAQAQITDQILEAAQRHLSSAYQTILTTTVDELMSSAVQRMEEAVNYTRRQMEREMCHAVESHSQYLGRQYELQVSWVRNRLEEKYENIVKKQGQKCTEEMERIRKEYMSGVLRSLINIQAEHATDLVIQACEKSLVHHEEKKHLENNFGAWFIGNFENEILNRDFTILELEDVIRKLEAQSQRREEQLKDVFRHFQKFINFALEEKPGQAEFLLSLEKEMKSIRSQVNTEGEVEFIATLILDYILKCISEKTEHKISPKGKEVEEYTIKNFKDKISDQRVQNRVLTLVGEEKSNHKPETLSQRNNHTTEKEHFKKSQLKSLLNTFYQNPSIVKIINSMKELPIAEIINHRYSTT